MAQSKKKPEEEELDPRVKVLTETEQMLQSQIDELREDVGQLTVALTKLAQATEVTENDMGSRISAIESIPILATHLRTAHAS